MSLLATSHGLGPDVSYEHLVDLRGQASVAWVAALQPVGEVVDARYNRAVGQHLQRRAVDAEEIGEGRLSDCDFLAPAPRKYCHPGRLALVIEGWILNACFKLRVRSDSSYSENISIGGLLGNQS